MGRNSSTCTSRRHSQCKLYEHGTITAQPRYAVFSLPPGTLCALCPSAAVDTGGVPEPPSQLPIPEITAALREWTNTLTCTKHNASLAVRRAHWGPQPAPRPACTTRWQLTGLPTPRTSADCRHHCQGSCGVTKDIGLEGGNGRGTAVLRSSWCVKVVVVGAPVLLF